MAERPCDLNDFKRWVNLRLNFSLWVTFRANIYGPLDGGMVILQRCRWTFYTKKLYSSYSIEVDFYLKTQIIAFLSHPLGHLFVIIALFAISYG